MGKKLVHEKRLIAKRKLKKARMEEDSYGTKVPIPQRKAHRQVMAEIRKHYRKPVNLKADFEADDNRLDYWFRQVYSPDDVDNPLMVKFDRASFLGSAGYAMGKPTIVVMSPQEFIDLNPSTHIRGTERGVISKEKYKRVKEALEKGDWEPMPMTSEGPYVEINGTAEIIGHEGRHRAEVLRDMDVKEMPVLIWDVSWRDEDYRDHEPWIVPEANRIVERKKQLRKIKERRSNH